MQSINSKLGKLGRFAGRLVEGVFIVVAGILIGGGLFGVLGAMARGSVLEQGLAGGAIGACWGVLRTTGFRYALSAGVGAGLGWGIGTVCGTFYIAIFGAVVGGYVGARFRRPQPTVGEKEASAKAFALRLIGTLAGGIVGGFAGAVVSGWLCIIIVFGVPPWRLPRTVDQGGLLIFAVGVLGGIVGAVFGGRCLYLWFVRRSAARPQPENTIGDYEQWKQRHVPSLKDEDVEGPESR